MLNKTLNLGTIIVDNLRSEFIKKAFNFVGEKQILLDLGCGRRPFNLLYSKYANNSIGVDVPFTTHEKNKVDVYALGTELPFKNAIFDIILCTDVMEHIDEPQKLLKEVHRVLKLDGYLMLTTPFLVPIHEEPYDFYRYTIYGLKHLLNKSEFQIISIEPFSEMIGVLISFLAQVQLKFWYFVSIKMNIHSIYSTINPLIFLFVYLPQITYLSILRRGKSILFFKKLIERLIYTTKGYGIIAKKQ